MRTKNSSTSFPMSLPSWSRWALLAVFVLGAAVLAIVCRGFFLEDAYMHLRYAENTVAAGRWSIWNVGEKPVSGSTSPLWLALLVLFRIVGVTPFATSKVLGAIALAGFFLDLHKFWRQRTNQVESTWINLAFALSLFTLIPLLFYAVCGMETIFVLWLLSRLILVRSITAHSIWSVFLVLARSEGAVIVFIITVVKYWRKWKQIILAGLPSFVVFTAYLIWHYFYFGHIFPNTYYAKADLLLYEGILYGARSLFLFLSEYYLIIVFAFLYLITRKINRLDGMVLAVWGFLIVYMLRVGGDNAVAFPHHRHFLVFVGFGWVYAFIFLVDIARRIRPQKLVLTMLILVSLMSHFTNETRAEGSPLRNLKGYVKAIIGLPGVSHSPDRAGDLPSITQILEHIPDNAVVATSAAGRVTATFLRLKFIDMLGLHNEHIAHHGKRQFGQVDTKTDMAYVISRKPDVIVLPIRSIYIKQGFVQRGVTHWRILVDEALSHPTMCSEYRFVPTRDQAIFVHEQMLDFLPAKLRETATTINCREMIKHSVT